MLKVERKVEVLRVVKFFRFPRTRHIQDTDEILTALEQTAPAPKSWFKRCFCDHPLTPFIWNEDLDNDRSWLVDISHELDPEGESDYDDPTEILQLFQEEGVWCTEKDRYASKPEHDVLDPNGEWLQMGRCREG